MTGTARARKKAGYDRAHPHPAHVRRVNPDHPHGAPLPVNCPVCRPAPKKWDRSKAGKAVLGCGEGVVMELEQRGVPIHPSHVTEQDWNTPDPHCPSWLCTVCRQYACALCDLEEEDDLAEPCPGKPWWE